jgi:hypothetical protein
MRARGGAQGARIPRATSALGGLAGEAIDGLGDLGVALVERCAYRFVVTTERCPTRRPASCSDAPEAAMIDTAECRSAYGVVGPTGASSPETGLCARR